MNGRCDRQIEYCRNYVTYMVMVGTSERATGDPPPGLPVGGSQPNQFRNGPAR